MHHAERRSAFHPLRSYALSAKISMLTNSLTPKPTAAVTEPSLNAKPSCIKVVDTFRHAVLPWEDRSENQTLLDALRTEHEPNGPTEMHLVEELAGIIWRKRRLQLAEAAIYRERLHKDATSTYNPVEIAGAALLVMTGK
jgi:hypothetical protein